MSKLGCSQLTNAVLLPLNEDLVRVPSDYYARNLMAAERKKLLFQESTFPQESADQRHKEHSKYPEETIMNLATQEAPLQKFQEIHVKVFDTGSKLLQYFQEICAGRVSEGTNNESLEAIGIDIQKALDALKQQKYQVAVIAAMKAGKSTFLNALIGAEVLASESEACTVCQTDIKPIAASQTAKLLEYREDPRHPVLLAEGQPDEIRRVFMERTHEIRSSKNQSLTSRFELQHPIEAIERIPSLAGFTLVDTPGPNEWESAGFNAVALKQTALQVMRNCDAILFILDYTSFKDNTNSELLRDLIEKRSEFLNRGSNKIYFVLNKVDRKAEKDREIPEVIADLREALISFGIAEPIIYPASAWQGLLSKLIVKGIATKEHKKDFKNFFIARYISEDEEGDLVIPKMADIAPTALRDSGIQEVERSVIQAIVHNSGWSLLSEVIAELKKSAQSIEEFLATEIRGWEIELEQLEQKVEEYKQRSDSAREKVRKVKKSINQQKELLVDRFGEGINYFSQVTKYRIEQEIDKLAGGKSGDLSSADSSVKPSEGTTALAHKPISFPNFEMFPGLGSLSERIEQVLKDIFGQTEKDSSKQKLKSEQDVEKVVKAVNEYCTPLIHDFWLDTQDKLTREGTEIRASIVEQIKEEIQAISDEVSDYLGDALQIEIESSPIRFPGFEFAGIDAKVQQQQEVFVRYKKEKRTESRCCNSDKTYEIKVPYKQSVSYYEIDWQETLQVMKKRIDDQAANNKFLLERVIDKQVAEDFAKAEKQINDYINRFQLEFDYLLKERARREIEAPDIIEILNHQQMNVRRYLDELKFLSNELENWQSAL